MLFTRDARGNFLPAPQQPQEEPAVEGLDHAQLLAQRARAHFDNARDMRSQARQEADAIREGAQATVLARHGRRLSFEPHDVDPTDTGAALLLSQMEDAESTYVRLDFGRAPTSVLAQAREQFHAAVGRFVNHVTREWRSAAEYQLQQERRRGETGPASISAADYWDRVERGGRP